MPSLKCEDLEVPVERYLCQLISSISGKTDSVICGCIDVGQKKLSDAFSPGIPVTDEDGVLSYSQSTQLHRLPRLRDECHSRRKTSQIPLR
jgi:BRCT domain type II-containing protein